MKNGWAGSRGVRRWRRDLSVLESYCGWHSLSMCECACTWDAWVFWGLPALVLKLPLAASALNNKSQSVPLEPIFFYYFFLISGFYVCCLCRVSVVAADLEQKASTKEIFFAFGDFFKYQMWPMQSLELQLAQSWSEFLKAHSCPRWVTVLLRWVRANEPSVTTWNHKGNLKTSYMLVCELKFNQSMNTVPHSVKRPVISL